MSRATEAQCQQAIVEAAKRGKWLVHAERPAQRQSGKWSTPIQGHAGFPDLVLISPDHHTLLFVELKRKPNKVEPNQWRWLDALSDFARYSGRDDLPTLDVRVVWVPEELDEWCQALANGHVPEVVPL